MSLLLWDAIDRSKGGSIDTSFDVEIAGVPIGFASFTNIARPSPFRTATHSDDESNGNSVAFMHGEHDVLSMHIQIPVLITCDVIIADYFGIKAAVCVAVSLPYAIASHVPQSQMWDASPSVVSRPLPAWTTVPCEVNNVALVQVFPGYGDIADACYAVDDTMGRFVRMKGAMLI